MRLWESAAALGVLAIATGCGGATKSSGGSGSPSTTNVSAETACGDIFDTDFGTGCDFVVPPASELARERVRYISLCESALDLTGEVITASDLEACAQALKATGGCARATNEPAACVFPNVGGLPGGSTCADDGQCSSGQCVPSSGSNLCGGCAAATPAGQDCSASDCTANTVCVGTPAVCQAVNYGSAGDACDSGANRCAPGLTCSTVTMLCAVPAGVDAPCHTQSDCDSTLLCGPSTQVCQSRGTAGQSCATDAECVGSLGCVPDAQGQTQCGAVTWASSGQTCGGTVRCLVGQCSVASGVAANSQGVCPDVIPDGQPCSLGESSATCDVFSECTGGTCILGEMPGCP
jgi:hypothetical protein